MKTMNHMLLTQVVHPSKHSPVARGWQILLARPVLMQVVHPRKHGPVARGWQEYMTQAILGQTFPFLLQLLNHCHRTKRTKEACMVL